MRGAYLQSPSGPCAFGLASGHISLPLTGTCIRRKSNSLHVHEALFEFLYSAGLTMASKIPSKSAMSPISQSGNDPFDMKSTLAALPEKGAPAELSAIRIRRLPPNFDTAQLRSLLTIADKLESTSFVATSPGEQGFRTAIARFFTPTAAQQAQSILDRKQIDPDKSRLIVEVLRLSPGSIGSERHNFDLPTSLRAHSGSSAGSGSRFGGQYPPMNQISPPKTTEPAGPQDGYMGERQRVSGRDMIGQDGPEEEPSELLRDPMGYATNGLSRRNTDKSLYHDLSLSTSNPNSPPPLPGYVSPPHSGLRSPASNMKNMPPSYQVRHPQFPRSHMPPVNPADQNPPCNTLYVGNLPIDTSEDELKAMFSKQRGYKRLCFRTKQNGPMCFVEFEDVSFATKALNDLYGYPLHNSAHRGGIRLSFSKNPLGVRSGQPGGLGGPQTPVSPSGQFPGMNGMNMQSFTTANGPPPGIPTPPGLPMTTGGANSMSPTSMAFPVAAMSPTSMAFGMSDINTAMGGGNPYAGGWSPYGGR